MTSALVQISRDLAGSLAEFRTPAGVSYICNPLDYAREPHELYLERYGGPPKEVVLLGMNPGPWGMAQTGVPFGEVTVVRDWLHIDGAVTRPTVSHPKRPIEGFQCTRREVSGSRLWGWAKGRYPSPGAFFSRFFVANYCPLVFYDADGRNITPDRLPREARNRLYPACDEAVVRLVDHLGAKWVLGVGRFAADRAAEALAGMDVRTGRVTHPSPANPRANRGWEILMELELKELGIEIP
ncbi:MAG: single-stranded DNA-binding protein [bacterium]|nr:MAG: single-stranded DNA-binding protein [bacterium]